jgi:hypothetical protein
MQKITNHGANQIWIFGSEILETLGENIRYSVDALISRIFLHFPKPDELTISSMYKHYPITNRADAM